MSRPAVSSGSSTSRSRPISSLNPTKRKIAPSSSRPSAAASPAASCSGRQPFGSARDAGFGDELYQTGIKDESGRIREFSVCD